MITLDELLDGNDYESLSPEIHANLQELLIRINKVRAAWGKPMIVNSGLRTMEHHIEIYKDKAKREGKVFNIKKVPMKSRHLRGQAVDISDPKRELQKWCSANVTLLESVGLWMESFVFTKTWCHFQINPPQSGRRFFMP